MHSGIGMLIDAKSSTESWLFWYRLQAKELPPQKVAVIVSLSHRFAKIQGNSIHFQKLPTKDKFCRLAATFLETVRIE
jgi:hypothetical protein